MRLAQTLAGTWVITIPNPEEAGWETELACFDTTSTVEGSPAHQALEQAAAMAARHLRDALGRDLRVTSHNTDAVARMTSLLV